VNEAKVAGRWREPGRCPIILDNKDEGQRRQRQESGDQRDSSLFGRGIEKGETQQGHRQKERRNVEAKAGKPESVACQLTEAPPREQEEGKGKGGVSQNG
jgi:hypothetical protein